MCVCVCRWADDETLLDPAATKLQTVLIALPVRHDFLEVRREDEQEEDDGIICSPTGTETNVQREANFANPASLLPIASRAAPEAAKIDKDRLKQPDGEEGETTFRIKQDGDHFATDEDAAECGITVAASKECHELVHAGDRPMAQQLYPDTDSDGQDASEVERDEAEHSESEGAVAISRCANRSRTEQRHGKDGGQESLEGIARPGRTGEQTETETHANEGVTHGSRSVQQAGANGPRRSSLERTSRGAAIDAEAAEELNARIQWLTERERDMKSERARLKAERDKAREARQEQLRLHAKSSITNKNLNHNYDLSVFREDAQFETTDPPATEISTSQVRLSSC